MALILAWNAYAAIRWTHARTSEDSMVLRAGVKWGLAIGCAWGLVAFVAVNVFAPNNKIEGVDELEEKAEQLPSWNRRGGRRPGW